MELFADKRILTVTQLSSLIRGVLEENFEHVWVEGEISNLATPVSGHLYFTLKDAGAQLRCVMFRASARALRFKPKDGMGMIVRGRVTVYEQRGDYQLIVEYLEPKGIGALQMAFIQLKEKLAREGLFAEEHKQAIPHLPQRIGIVTSATGAAIHDMLNVLSRRYANVEVLIRPVKVQGEGAAAEIAEAIGDFNRYGKVDVMIVGRGGGSLEDLWAFNEEVVARAIFKSRIPVISAVGHEVDYTIADFVADLRAPTPSAAAELVVKSKEELVGQVEHLSHRLTQSMHHRLAEEWGALDGLSRSLKDPSMLIGHLAQRVDDLSARRDILFAGALRRHRDRCVGLVNHLRLTNPALQIERVRERLTVSTATLEASFRRRMEHSREVTAVATARLHALSPLLTLSRGYAVALRQPGGEVVRESADISPGDRLDLIFHRGGASCTVDTISD